MTHFIFGIITFTPIDVVAFTYALARLVGFLIIAFLLFSYRKSLQEDVFPRLTNFLFKRGKTEVAVTLDAPNPIRENSEVASDPPATSLVEEGPKIENKTSGQHFSDMFDRLFLDRDLEAGEVAFQQLQTSTDDATSKLRNEALYYWLRFRASDSAALEKLKGLLEYGELKGLVYYYIGLCYEQSGDFAKAAGAYVTSADNYESIERAESLVHAARCRYKNGQASEASFLLMSEINKVNEDEVKFILYKGLATLYEFDNNSLLRAIALEKAVEYKPNEREVLFGAAYSYTDEHLALLHYKTLINFTPENAMALNNLAVAYEQLGMPLKAVSVYRQAWNLGNTLSAANLAYRFMNAGFSNEASAILSEAQKVDDVHPNVASATAAISQKREGESSLEKRSLDLARERQKFILGFANAYFQSSGSDAFKGSWTNSNGTEITIEQHAQQISATWVEGYTTYTLAGEACNLGAIVTLKSKTDLGILNTEKSGLTYVSADREEIKFMLYKDQDTEMSSFKKKH